MFDVTLATKEGFNFDVKVTSENGNPGVSYFGGKGWENFAKIYVMEPGHELYFSIDGDGTTTRVMPETYPIIHPSNFFLMDLPQLVLKLK